MITCGNGWNFHPKNFEEMVQRHPAVTAAMMVGSGQIEAKLPVETKDPTANAFDRELVLNDVYATIERACNENGNKPITRVLPRNVILVTRPFVRTAKTNIAKKKTIDLSKAEIEEHGEHYP